MYEWLIIHHGLKPKMHITKGVSLTEDFRIWFYYLLAITNHILFLNFTPHFLFNFVACHLIQTLSCSQHYSFIVTHGVFICSMG